MDGNLCFVCTIQVDTINAIHVPFCFRVETVSASKIRPVVFPLRKGGIACGRRREGRGGYGRCD